MADSWKLIQLEDGTGESKGWIFRNLAQELGYAITRCEHEWSIVWLTDDLEGFKCVNCGFETVDIEKQ